MKRIFVSPTTIQANEDTGRRDPTIVVLYPNKVPRIYHRIEILGPSAVKYDPEGQEKYGARVFIETEADLHCT